MAVRETGAIRQACLDIETVRLGVPRWVVAGREKRDCHHLAQLYLCAPDLERV